MTSRYGCVLALALVVAACGGPTAASHVLTGTFLLSNGEPPDRAVGCSGTGGYADVAVGTDVVVRDDAGTIIGSSKLAADPGGPEPAGSGAYQCGFVFSVSELPDAPFYVIEVGDRGELTYSAADLEAVGWSLDLTLGD